MLLGLQDWQWYGIINKGGFRPNKIAGLQLWLDAADNTTVFQDAAKTIPAGDGDVIGAWADKSGNGKDATQATTAQKGTYQLGIVNTRPVVRFDGTDDGYEIGDFSSLSGSEVFVVVKIDTDPPPDSVKTGLWDFGTNASNTHFPFDLDGKIYDEFGSTTRQVTATSVPSLAQFNIYNVVSIANEWTSRLNNAQLFTTVTNTVGFRATTFLGKNVVSSTFLDGDIAELILYNAKLGAGNRALVNGYLSNKYGVTLS